MPKAPYRHPRRDGSGRKTKDCFPGHAARAGLPRPVSTPATSRARRRPVR
jgi:hypothetical protein